MWGVRTCCEKNNLFGVFFMPSNQEGYVREVNESVVMKCWSKLDHVFLTNKHQTLLRQLESSTYRYTPQF